MNEQIDRVIHHPAFIPVTTGVISFAAGAATGYFLGRHMNKKQVHELPQQLELNLDVDTTLNEIKDDLARIKAKRLAKADEQFKPEPIIIDADVFEAKVQDIVDEEVVIEVVEEVVEEEVFMSSIFAHDDEDWNMEEEVKNRTPNSPYILHRDEFYSDEMDYSQTTLNYYAGDNIMCDEEDAPVYNHENVTGPLKFGHGSGDPNVFYVRNDKRNAEYEILYNTGLYSEEVLGLEIENNARVEDLKHSKVQRFRPD